ncbi:hypothetical protein DdX_05239 [Ditylenchus destructor]|uniref:Uncharacterized protein n=1 Tax=Ditylenchus destructor TaxID=166010 RepID=A0AAD4RAI0_9BILA|nr:hypothetical protein DdX_05239 [Ditylenchus destructor]
MKINQNTNHGYFWPAWSYFHLVKDLLFEPGKGFLSAKTVPLQKATQLSPTPVDAKPTPQVEPASSEVKDSTEVEPAALATSSDAQTDVQEKIAAAAQATYETAANEVLSNDEHRISESAAQNSEPDAQKMASNNGEEA